MPPKVSLERNCFSFTTITRPKRGCCAYCNPAGLLPDSRWPMISQHSTSHISYIAHEWTQKIIHMHFIIHFYHTFLSYVSILRFYTFLSSHRFPAPTSTFHCGIPGIRRSPWLIEGRRYGDTHAPSDRADTTHKLLTEESS